MSGFIPAGATWTGFLPQNDDVLQPVAYRRTLPGTRVGRRQDVDVLWPRSRLCGQDYANIAPIWDPMPQSWENNSGSLSGHSGPTKITGIVRDSSGNPIGGATVQLFNTATGLLVDTVTADAGGYYELSDPNQVACFVVAYLPGSPDTAGTTVNTLIGS